MQQKIMLPERSKQSHKGEAGKILVVGGSKKYYGAPIFTALAAEASGADLITIFLPQVHVEMAKNYSLNFFLNGFVDYDLGLKDIGLIIEESKKADVLCIGNGLDKEADTLRSIKLILRECKIPCVVDADALIPDILDIETEAELILTPHHAEFERVFGEKVTPENVQKFSKEYNLTIVVKGKTDIIASKGELYLNETGTPKMRVGGTGDALAGIIGSFVAQKMQIVEAAKSACELFGLAGEALEKQKEFFTTYELIKFFPEFIVPQNIQNIKNK